jgi:osmotically-inducible protein OsmY
MDNRSLLSGMAIGAALALAFDSNQGTRRRALIRDKMIRGTRRTGEALDATVRDMRNRARGIAAATRSRLRNEEVDDNRLVERVRAKLGRVCSHPRAIDVYVSDGEVTLIGPALADEVRDLLSAAASVRGVHSVVNELEPHETPEGVASLQGEGRTAGSSLDLLHATWAPATRALVGAAALAAGGLAIAYSRR